ncbi:hypothetical protein GCM10009836_28760 [Pseudonocardia ailaonensis]|uniref:Uncharacterized protein n=1 Tax=Pseudonocardia ailaonensis TaxID=367279 RepID=A0ABN2N184_9PSEU
MPAGAVEGDGEMERCHEGRPLLREGGRESGASAPTGRAGRAQEVHVTAPHPEKHPSSIAPGFSTRTRGRGVAAASSSQVSQPLWMVWPVRAPATVRTRDRAASIPRVTL